jgi:hypothetical protein
MLFDGKVVHPIGKQLLEPADYARVTDVGLEPLVSYDPAEDRFLFAFARAQSNKHTVVFTTNSSYVQRGYILPYNARLRIFESNGWTTLGVSALGQYFGTAAAYPNTTPSMLIGSYYGQFWSSTSGGNSNDGTNTQTEAVAATSVAGGPIFNGDIVFPTADANDFGLPGYFYDSDQRLVGIMHFADPLNGTLNGFPSVGAGATIAWLGGRAFKIQTKWFDAQQAFVRKRFDRLYLHLSSKQAAPSSMGEIGYSPLAMWAQVDFKNNDPITFFDAVEETGVPAIQPDRTDYMKRVGLFKNATALRVTVVCAGPSDYGVVRKIAVTGKTLSDRYLRT